jgi:hypothetical protein
VSTLQELDEFEDELVARFAAHPVLAGVTRLPDEDFAALLLQRRFVSLAFTPAYDLAIDLLEDEQARRIARAILREEYPDSSGATRSHREEMTEDLRRLGIDRETLLTTRPTEATRHSIEAIFALIAAAGGGGDLQVLTVLRFWGEVLVSVEYGRLWERMEPLLVQDGENRSSFYHPHHVHDAKLQPLATPPLEAASHSDRLATQLRQLLAAGGSTEAFRTEEECCLQLKLGFYDQFRPGPSPPAPR